MISPNDADDRDLDDALKRHFQATALPDAGFSRNTATRICHARRRRQWVLALSALGSMSALVWLAPGVERILIAWRAVQATVSHEPALWACLFGLLLLGLPSVLSELFSSDGVWET